MDVKLAFGVRDGKTILISELTEAERGGNCNCTCPACGEPLIAKKGNKNRHHFAHKTDSTCDIAHANESALHRYAKEIIQAHKRILLPGWEITHSDLYKTGYNIHVAQQVKISLPPKCAPFFFSFKSASLEKQMGQIIADIAVTLPNKDLLVEIAVTHPVDEKKKAYIKEQDIPMIEIDLKALLKEDLTAPNIKDTIIRAILNNSENRKWVHNPEKEKLLAQKQEEFEEKYKKLNLAHEAKIAKIEQDRQKKQSYKDNNIQTLRKLMEPKNYKQEILRLRSDRQALAWMEHFILPEKITNLDIIPFYLDIPITGEFVFKCDRRVWQGKIFEDYVCRFDDFYLKSAKNRLCRFDFIKFDKSRAYRTTVSIDDQEKEVSLSSDVLKKYFDYLSLLGFVDWIYYNHAEGSKPTSLAPPNAHIAEALQEAIRTVDPYHPNVDRRIEEELRKRIPDDPIWKNPFLSYTLKNTVYYAPSQK